MGCNHPRIGYRARKVNEATGARPVVFRFPEGIPGTETAIPCGKCNGCLIDRSMQWGIRCYHEAKLHEHNQFITLSYDREHLPKDHMLNKKHLQDFFKRLRKRTGQKLRYLACGEYGPKTYRAHYHAAVFGLEIPDLIYYKDGKNGDKLYTSAFIEEVWGKGLVVIGNLTFASAQYVAKYTVKKHKLFKRLVEAENFVPPFNVMSRRPGLGMDWLRMNWEDVYPRDFITIDGKKYKPPRAYDKWLNTFQERVFREVKRARLIQAFKEHRAEDQHTRDLRGIARETIQESTQGTRDDI